MHPNSLRHYWTRVRAAFTVELPDTHWLRRRLMVDPNHQVAPDELRHFCGSVLADRGLSAQDIAQFLGNSARICEEGTSTRMRRESPHESGPHWIAMR